jgi:hypothetical protein
LSVQVRAESRSPRLFGHAREHIERVADSAEHELVARRNRSGFQSLTETTLSVETEFGLVGIELATPMTSLARNLFRAVTPSAALAALRESELKLDGWEKSRRATASEQGRTILPFGIEVRWPEDFRPR